MSKALQRDVPGKDSLEIFKTLPESDFWPYLSRRTRCRILDLLGDDSDLHDNETEAVQLREC